MLFVVVALWSAAVIVLVLDPKRATARWLSAVAFCGGCGGMAVVIFEMIRPAVIEAGNIALDEWLSRLQLLCSLLSYYGLPYTFVMFAMNYAPNFPVRWKRILSWVMLVPICTVLLLITPRHPIPYAIVAVWVVPSILFGILLLLITRESNPMLSKAHRLTQMAVIPPVLFALMMNYILPLFGLFEKWRYNSWIVAIAFVIFVISLFTYGFMGVQVLIKRKRLDFTIRAITSGTAMLNHAIKNDIGKIRLFGEKIKREAEQSGQTELVRDVETMIAASAHVQEMIRKVKDRTQDIELEKEERSAVQLVRDTVRSMRPALEHIEVIEHYSEDKDMDIWCDPAHMTEVLQNLMNNAIEATPRGGAITLRVYRHKRWVVIAVNDTGSGIEKEHLKHVMEPFFTTKGGRQSNFGLGLAYCYHAVAKHGGELHIESEPGQGTAVTVYLPASKKKG